MAGEIDEQMVQQAIRADLGQNRQNELPLGDTVRGGSSYTPSKKNGVDHIHPELRKTLTSMWMNIRISDAGTREVQGLDDLGKANGRVYDTSNPAPALQTKAPAPQIKANLPQKPTQQPHLQKEAITRQAQVPMNHINAVPRLALPGWDQPVANNQTEGLKRLSSANRLVKTAPPPNPNTSSAVLAAPLPPPSAPVCVSTVPDKPVTSAPQEASTPVPDTSDDVKQEVQVQLSAPPSILDENEEETAGQEPLVDLKEAESDEKHLDGFNKLALQATGTITVTTESVDALERTVLSTWNRRLGDSANPVSLGQDMMALLGLIQKIRAQDSGEGSQKEQKENKGQKDNEEQKGDEATAQVVVDTTPSTNLELLQHGYTPQANPQDAAASKQRITYSADIIKSQRPSPVASPGPAQPPKLVAPMVQPKAQEKPAAITLPTPEVSPKAKAAANHAGNHVSTVANTIDKRTDADGMQALEKAMTKLTVTEKVKAPAKKELGLSASIWATAPVAHEGKFTGVRKV